MSKIYGTVLSEGQVEVEFYDKTSASVSFKNLVVNGIALSGSIAVGKIPPNADFTDRPSYSHISRVEEIVNKKFPYGTHSEIPFNTLVKVRKIAVEAVKKMTVDFPKALEMAETESIRREITKQYQKVEDLEREIKKARAEIVLLVVRLG
jgi:hypothetical protein